MNILFDPGLSVTLAKMLSKIVMSFSALKMMADSLSFFVCSRISLRSACVNYCFYSCIVMIMLSGRMCEKAYEMICRLVSITILGSS